MQTVTLGKSGLTVSRLGYGSGVLGNSRRFISEPDARATLLGAWQAGITLFDTSPFYGMGLSELRLGQLFRDAPRDHFVISTKVGRVIDPLGRTVGRKGVMQVPPHAGGVPQKAYFDYSYDGVLRSIEQSLLRLGTDRLDIVLIHDVDVWTHGDMFEQRFGEAMDGAYRALDALRTEGVISAVGVGVNEADVCARFARAGDFDTMLLAGRYTLLEQPAIAEFMPLAVEKSISLILGGVLNSGILATGAIEGALYNYKPAPADILQRTRRIEDICRAHDCSLLQAALQFPLAHPAVASLVLGAVNPAEIEKNVNALNAPVPYGLWDDLKSADLLDDAAPTPRSDRR